MLDICLSILIELIEFSFVFSVYCNNHLALKFSGRTSNSILYAE